MAVCPAQAGGGWRVHWVTAGKTVQEQLADAHILHDDAVQRAPTIVL